MRPQKVTDPDMIKGLMEVFRSKGFDGASLAELSNASGLKKASLYHRFPEGKQAMADAVLEHAKEWGEVHIYQLLSDHAIPPKKRLTKVVKNLNMLYQKGEATCILRALSMDTGMELFDSKIKEGMSGFIDGFKNLGLSFGFKKSIAHQKALQALILIQGSLVVSKGMNDTSIFKDTLAKLAQLFEE